MMQICGSGLVLGINRTIQRDYGVGGVGTITALYAKIEDLLAGTRLSFFSVDAPGDALDAVDRYQSTKSVLSRKAG